MDEFCQKKLWMNFYQIIKELNNFSLMQYVFKKISHILFRRFLFFNSSHEEASAMKNILARADISTTTTIPT